MPFRLRIRQLLLLVLITCGQGLFAHKTAVNFCHFYLAEEAEGLSEATRLFAYLQELLKAHVVSIESLKKLQISLANHTKLENPVINQSGSDHKIHAEQVDLYLASMELDQKELLINLNSFLAEQEQVKVNKSDSIEATKKPTKKMKFNKVEMPDSTILMMDTHVTQQMWVDLMGERPTSTAENSFNENPSDLPVTSISWWSAIIYANTLSLKENIEPVYKIDHIAFDKHGTAAAGNLKLNDSYAIAEPIINDTGGYRLPTQLEQKWIRSQRTNVLQADWTSERTKFIKPVAELEPYIIYGNKFYDLLGNVYEWSQDQDLSAGRDITKIDRLISGRCFVDNISDATFMKSVNQNFCSSYVGFRLVRTVKEKKP